MTKAARLRQIFERPQLDFLMEAHNGLSAKIAQEAGFEGIWASGLSISAALGVRDSNEASWTQILEVLEFMCDATEVPILVDGDTGYGNFNNMRRLVRKLEQRGVGGVCIEDKIFPKTNSFIRGTTQPLADVDEFCGRIAAGQDSKRASDFVIVARVEALIAGWGLEEALRRAEAYRQAGADAILIHSALSNAREIVAFKQEWADRLPVAIVPTKYYGTPTDVFREHGFSVAIWANHLMRSSLVAMQRTAAQIFEDQSLVNVEDRVAPLEEVFRLQGAPELIEAEKLYLPTSGNRTRAIVLAAAHGPEFGELTAEVPKSMLVVSGAPILEHIAATYRAAGISGLCVVRGYRKEAIDLAGASFYDNDEADATGEVFALYQARAAIEGSCIISYGDVLFKRYIAQELMDQASDFAITVDTEWAHSRNRDRLGEYAVCAPDGPERNFYEPGRLLRTTTDASDPEISAEWMGFLGVSPGGAKALRELLDRLLREDEQRFRRMDMVELLNEIVRAGNEIRVLYTTGGWLDVDRVNDVVEGSTFQ